MRRRPVFLAALVALASVCTGLAVTSGGVQAADVTIVLDGHGNGHGVGMSQWGAYGYAVDQGWSAAQILDHYYGGTVASSVPLDTNIRVRLQNLDGAQTALAVDSGSLVVAGLPTGAWRSVLARWNPGTAKYDVWARADVVRCPSAADAALTGWTRISTAVLSQVDVRTAVDSTSVSSTTQLISSCEPSGVVRWYRGTVRAVNAAGAIRTVNVLPLEQYLRTVIAMEMSPGWATAGGGNGAQALRAQAVAARSYAVAYPAASTPSTYADVCDMVCQSYFGVAFKPAGGLLRQVEHPATDAAVAATAGVVRRVANAAGAVALTMFSASNGGYTATNNHPLTPFPAVPDTGDATAANPNHTWSVSLTGSAISAKYPAIGTFAGLSVTSRNGFGEWGGRVLQLTLTGTLGTQTVTGADFRSKMGLKDTWFNVRGASAPPTPSDPCAGRVTPPVAGPFVAPAAAGFVPVGPVRIVDSRFGKGTAKAPLGAGCTMVVDPGLDPSITSVVVNITSVKPSSNGYLTVYACGTPRPGTSALQMYSGRVVAGTSTVSLSAGGTFCVYSSATTDLVVDLFGSYSAAGARFQPVTPGRVYDTRSLAAPLPAGTLVKVKVTGLASVPVGATAASLTLHGLSPATDGYVVAWPCTTSRPSVSALSVTAGVSVTNHLQVALSSTGVVCLYLTAPMHIAIDVSGWFGPGATTRYYAMSPVRMVDTTKNVALSGGFTAGANRAVALAGRSGLPAAATLKAVAAQVSALGASSAGWLTVHPCLSPVPAVSMVRYVAGAATATGVVGADDASGRWCISASSAVHVVVDVGGWYG